jgi:TRAP-type uncharacterized transport system fused permease subunit
MKALSKSQKYIKPIGWLAAIFCATGAVYAIIQHIGFALDNPQFDITFLILGVWGALLYLFAIPFLLGIKLSPALLALSLFFAAYFCFQGFDQFFHFLNSPTYFSETWGRLLELATRVLGSLLILSTIIKRWPYKLN